MRHRALIEQATLSNDAVGEPAETWSHYATRSCEVIPLTPREVIQAEQVQGKVPWKLRFHYDSKTKAIKSHMRVTIKTLDNKVLYCDGPSAPIDGMKRFVRVMAMEQTD